MMNEMEKSAGRKPVSPSYGDLNRQYIQAYQLVDDIVLKNYINKLSDMDIIPLDKSIVKNNIGENVRFFKITEMIYQKDEYAAYKFATVFDAVSNLECSVFIMVNSDGTNTDFYMGIRSLNSKRTTSSLVKTLKNSLLGQFPGVKTSPDDSDSFLDSDMRTILEQVESGSIATASCVAQNKDEDITDNKSFLQGLEKLAISMQGQRYTGIIIANGTTSGQLQLIKKGYENIYTQLSPFSEMQISFGENDAYNISKAFSVTDTQGTSYSKNFSKTTGTSDTHTVSDSTTEDSKLSKGLAASAIGIQIVGSALAPFTGGISYFVCDAISDTMLLAGNLAKKTKTHGESDAHTVNQSETTGDTYGENKTTAKGETDTTGLTTGTSKNLQLTRKNKTIQGMLERIDLQLKRIKEFESLGMWECAAYFLSDNQYSAEIAASTYKALMRGENSGVEVSAVNTWGSSSGGKTEILKDYIKNFIHPVFAYHTDMGIVPVNACSFVSGNELAIHIGLPRKSVSGFPVIEHAEFGKDVLRYSSANATGGIKLGKIYDMGIEQPQLVNLSRKSLAMHTFITGSTGSGKSNTVYQILNQLDMADIPFLVVEPAKGEYKNVFGNNENVSVYGTNPAKSPLLRINPFSFPDEIHILEHLDRLVEIFNVCWPMYAAMPAVLKEAIEKSYEEAGWDLQTSTNKYKQKLYPLFKDVVNNIRKIIDTSEYSEENKGNYKGSLVTRLNSLTNGINGMIFTNNELTNAELFDSNVVADLSRVGSMETKALIMGLLVMKLQEYRMASGNMNNDLQHVTILEEAHNLLKRTSTEQSSESSNLLGKSVEMLANAIAEMRTYGEGFIIADQAPGLLDMSAIRNTNTKIILRLPDESDRELVGRAAGLNDDQIIELAKLQCGVAAVYQNDWIQPVLCKVAYFKTPDEDYKYNVEDAHKNLSDNTELAELKKRITYYLLSNMVKEPHEKNIDNLKDAILQSNLETGLKTRIYDYIGNYTPPKTIDTISDIISAMYTYSNKAVDRAKKGFDITHEWAKMLHDEITPCLDTFNNDIQQIIMNCIIINIACQEDILRDLPKHWMNLVKG
jgi:hypothetical protein